MVLVRSRVRLARDGRGIAGEEHQVVKAVQDEASPAALRRKTPEAQDLLLAEHEGALGGGARGWEVYSKEFGG